MRDKCSYCGCLILVDRIWCLEHAPIGHYDDILLMAPIPTPKQVHDVWMRRQTTSYTLHGNGD